MVRFPALEAPKKPPASDCDLLKSELKVGVPLWRLSRTPLGVPRFSWLRMLLANAEILMLYFLGTL